ncbi:carbonic anhydrase 2 [Eupeodes corollae]|uniref:carbonic anhydrase 2 n=1 Tax=Eupeodes corollae TaxID=290404 RepID=UPI00248F9371|nr:carbonic anhydrase 2 [Eupeodes corollae]
MVQNTIFGSSRSISFLIIIQVVLLSLGKGVNSHFGYSESNQRRWGKHHGHCFGKLQSPISVQHSKAVPLHMPAIDLIGYHNLLAHPLKLMNNGHTVSITIPKFSQKDIENGEVNPYIRGGKLPGEFEVEGVHFHWGDRNNRGAEHVINDIRYTMEMHIVHRNKKYELLSDALQQRDGAAVLAFFFMLDDSDHEGLAAISKHLPLIENTNESVYLNTTFSLSSLMSKIDLDKFYTYRGSLTTPPCSEAITWVLYPEPLPISPKQISRFRQLQDNIDGALVDNFRALQPIGNRRIFVRATNIHNTHVSKLENEISYTKWDWFF